MRGIEESTERERKMHGGKETGRGMMVRREMFRSW